MVLLHFWYLNWHRPYKQHHSFYSILYNMIYYTVLYHMIYYTILYIVLYTILYHMKYYTILYGEVTHSQYRNRSRSENIHNNRAYDRRILNSET